MSDQREQDMVWMRVRLSRRGIGVTSPNPAVGCVILDRAGQVVGVGEQMGDLLEFEPGAFVDALLG